MGAIAGPGVAGLVEGALLELPLLLLQPGWSRVEAAERGPVEKGGGAVCVLR